MIPPPPLDLAAVLDRLGYADGEHVQTVSQVPGERFVRAVVTPFDELPEVRLDRHEWFGINPVAGTPTDRPTYADEHRIAETWAEAKGRPDAADITRVAAVWIDLDVKVGGCPSWEVAEAIIGDVSIALGAQPVAVILSGHGLQPLWAIEDGGIGEGGIARTDARAILRRWGRLVRHLAELRGGKVDGVFDLPRILRRADSVNVKDPAEPRTVVVRAEPGSPVSLDRLAEVLDEYNVADLDTDHADPGALVSAPSDWQHRDGKTCSYAERMVAGWATDQPGARHLWLVAQATRVAVLHRAGCLSEAGHLAAVEALIARLQVLVGGDRGEGPGETDDALAWGVQRAAAMNDQQVREELGDHLHPEDAGDRKPVLARMRALTLVPDITQGDETGQPAATQGNGSLFDTDGNLALDPAAPTVQQTTLTDHGNAALFVARHRHRLRYVPSLGGWIRWNGHRWVACDDNAEAIVAAAETMAALEPENEAGRKHKDASLSRRGLESATVIGRADPGMRAGAEDLDADPYALNTPSGIVDLRTGQLRPSDPDELHTYSTAVPFDPEAKCPRFEAFLAQTFEADPDLVGYLQRLAGYSAAGVVTHHVLPFLHGGGGNGKSVFLDIVMHVLGDYATTAPPNFLLASSREDESAVARLKGLRLVVASEVSRSARFDEAKVKLLTGGDRLTARHLYARHFTFTPTHTLWLMGNHQPRVEAGGESFWRRLRLIPFTRTVPAHERVEGLAAQIMAQEGPGVLAWIVRGAAVALAGGLAEPASVLAATREYMAEEDALARFVGECLVIGGPPQVKLNTRDVRGAYESWCRDEGELPVPAQAFGRELRGRFGVETVRSNGQRFYLGVSHARTSGGPDSDRSDRPVTEKMTFGHWLNMALDQPLWGEQ